MKTKVVVDKKSLKNERTVYICSFNVNISLVGFNNHTNML